MLRNHLPLAGGLKKLLRLFRMEDVFSTQVSRSTLINSFWSCRSDRQSSIFPFSCFRVNWRPAASSADFDSPMNSRNFVPKFPHLCTGQALIERREFCVDRAGYLSNQSQVVQIKLPRQRCQTNNICFMTSSNLFSQLAGSLLSRQATNPSGLTSRAPVDEIPAAISHFLSLTVISPFGPAQ